MDISSDHIHSHMCRLTHTHVCNPRMLMHMHTHIYLHTYPHVHRLTHVQHTCAHIHPLTPTYASTHTLLGPGHWS